MNKSLFFVISLFIGVSYTLDSKAQRCVPDDNTGRCFDKLVAAYTTDGYGSPYTSFIPLSEAKERGYSNFEPVVSVYGTGGYGSGTQFVPYSEAVKKGYTSFDQAYTQGDGSKYTGAEYRQLTNGGLLDPISFDFSGPYTDPKIIYPINEVHQIHNGEIPEESLSYAKKLVGKFHSVVGSEIEFDLKANRLISKFKSPSNHPKLDLYGSPLCGIDLGQLQYFEYVAESREIRGRFKMLNPKNCLAAYDWIQVVAELNSKHEVTNIIFRYVQFLKTVCYGACQKVPDVSQRIYLPGPFLR